MLYPSSHLYAQTNLHLPDHLVWPVTLAKAERAGKVASKEWLLLDRGKQSLVDGLLVGGTAGRWLLCLFKF